MMLGFKCDPSWSRVVSALDAITDAGSDTTSYNHSDSDCEAQEHIVLDTIDVGGFFLSVVCCYYLCLSVILSAKCAKTVT